MGQGEKIRVDSSAYEAHRRIDQDAFSDSTPVSSVIRNWITDQLLSAFARCLEGSLSGLDSRQQRQPGRLTRFR